MSAIAEGGGGGRPAQVGLIAITKGGGRRGSMWEVQFQEVHMKPDLSLCERIFPPFCLLLVRWNEFRQGDHFHAASPSFLKD